MCPTWPRLRKQAVLIPWQVYPTMQHNDAFVDHLRQAGFTPDHHIYFLCRSGQRSLAAAKAAQEAGFPHVYNIADGFEGGVDADGHRGVRPAGRRTSCPGGKDRDAATPFPSWRAKACHPRLRSAPQQQ